jgi:hypothetical protein
MSAKTGTHASLVLVIGCAGGELPPVPAPPPDQPGAQGNTPPSARTAERNAEVAAKLPLADPRLRGRAVTRRERPIRRRRRCRRQGDLGQPAYVS